MVRRVTLEYPSRRLGRLASVIDQLHLHAASLESFPSIYQVFRTVQPNECYHLAAQSFVSYSFDDDFSTLNTNINGTILFWPR
jgi:GDPmannose 4,6-dehydratase